eukprot:scaffold2235_cov288-Pavlova_lutheri.AAC.5
MRVYARDSCRSANPYRSFPEEEARQGVSFPYLIRPPPFRSPSRTALSAPLLLPRRARPSSSAAGPCAASPRKDPTASTRPSALHLRFRFGAFEHHGRSACGVRRRKDVARHRTQLTARSGGGPRGRVASQHRATAAGKPLPSDGGQARKASARAAAEARRQVRPRDQGARTASGQWMQITPRDGQGREAAGGPGRCHF